MTPRHRVLLFALLATLLLAWQAPDRSGATEPVQLARVERTVGPMSPSGQRPASDASFTASVVQSVRPRLSGGDQTWRGRIFAPAGWRKPPPPMPKVTPIIPVEHKPPPPSAPPLPFRVLGRWQDAKGVAVFLSYYSDNLVARKGDQIAQYYRVEDIDEERLQLRYLPLDQLQQLEFEPPGEASP